MTDIFSLLVIIGFIILIVWICEQRDKEPPAGYTVPGLLATVPGSRVWRPIKK